jgi:hypothetical protein
MLSIRFRIGALVVFALSPGIMHPQSRFPTLPHKRKNDFRRFRAILNCTVEG